MEKVPNSRIRKLRTWMPSKYPSELIEVVEGNHQISLIDLASNDYLDLARHPSLIEAAKRTLATEGVGSGGSRFITGNRTIHKKLEQELAEWLNHEIVLVYASEVQANLAAVIAIADRHTPIIADSRSHHSLLT